MTAQPSPSAATVVAAPRSRGGQAWFQVAMTLPGAVFALGLMGFAFLLVIYVSFRSNDGVLIGAALGVRNYLAAVSEPIYAIVLLRSLAIAGLVTLATIVTAYPVAYYLAFRAGRWRGLILLLVTLPFWTSYLLRVFAWKIIFAYNGVLNSVLIGLGLTDQPTLMFLNAPPAVVITLAHAYAPFAILPILVALQTIPGALLEAADDLGARPFARFRRVILPMSLPGVQAAALVVFVPTLGDYVTPAMVGGPTSAMIGTMIQAQFGKANDWPFGAALAVIMMLVVLFVVLIVRRANRRFGSPT